MKYLVVDNPPGLLRVELARGHRLFVKRLAGKGDSAVGAKQVEETDARMRTIEHWFRIGPPGQGERKGALCERAPSRCSGGEEAPFRPGGRRR